MRYYDVRLTDTHGNLKYEWTSYHGNVPDPGAQDIALDAIVTFADAPPHHVGAMLTIYGVPLNLLQQSQTFYGLTITVAGGMGGGLPLETPAQRGVLIAGQVWESFGNWIGTDMTLNFVIRTRDFLDTTVPANRQRFTFTWEKGQSIVDALRVTIAAALGQGIKITPQLGNAWTAPFRMAGVYDTLQGLARTLAEHTKRQPGGPVRLIMEGSTLLVTDRAYQRKPKLLAFQDFIGQPTWVQRNVAQVTLVLRGDLQVGDYVMFPTGMLGAGPIASGLAPGFLTTTVSASPSQALSAKNRPTFVGVMQILEMRHLAQFRSTTGTEWATVVNLLLPDASAQTLEGSPAFSAANIA